MCFRKKKKVMGILEMAAAVMLITGCGGRDIQNRTEQAEADTASQLQQIIDGEDLSGETSPERQEQPQQQGQTERSEQQGQMEQSAQQEQSAQTEQLSDGGVIPDRSGSQAPDSLDADRIIEEQSFQVELNDWGEVRFVSYEPAHSAANPRADVTFYLLEEDEVVYQFPYIGTGDMSDHGLYYDVKFVLFTDTNTDGKDDVVIGAEYMTGAGPQGAIPHTVVRIYEDNGSHFTYNEELSDEINGYLPWESNVLARDVKRLLQLTGGNGPLTDYESYTGKWRAGSGYIAAYEETDPVSRNELTCSISNGVEFSGSLFTEQGMTERFASVDDIAGTIQNGELYYEFTDDGWGGTGTLYITFLPNQINVEVLNYQLAEENVIGYGISGSYEMTIRE